MRGISWLMSTSWPIYAAIVLGTNIVGAVAIMTFVVFFLPMPEIQEFTRNFDNLFGLGAAYVIFAVIVGMAATILLFRPVWDWQRNPDAHDPNMVRNLVMRIPIYQAAVAALVWLIGIGITVAITSGSDARLALVVGVSSTLAGMIVVLITYLQAERMVRPVAATALARRFEDSTLEPPIKQRLYLSWIMSTGVPLLGIVLVFVAQTSGLFTDNANDILPAVVALTLTAFGTGAMATAYSTMSVVDPISHG